MVLAQNYSMKALRTICGSSTGDEVVIDENGQRWLVVPEFSRFRATGERRSILKYGAIFET